MKHLITASLVLCLQVLAVPAQAQDIMALLAQKADAPARLAPNTIDYLYTLTLDVTEHEGKEMSGGEAVFRVDPTQPGGSRVEVISSSNPDSKALQNFLEELEDPEKSMAKQAEGFWCGTSESEKEFDLDLKPDSFTLISETDTEAVIRPDMAKFAGLMMQSDEEEIDGLEKKMMEKMIKRLEGEMTISKPDLEMKSFSVRMTRPMTMMVVMKIKEMNMDQQCALAPNGHYHMASMKMNMKAKAIGIKVEQNMDVRISDLTPLP